MMLLFVFVHHAHNNAASPKASCMIHIIHPRLIVVDLIIHMRV